MQTLVNRFSTPVRNGFSLLEMLIVVSIILILATVAVPKFSTAGDKANEAKIKTDLQTISSAAALYQLDKGKSPTMTELIDDGNYLEFKPVPPKGNDGVAGEYKLENGVASITWNKKTYSSNGKEETASQNDTN